MHSLLFLALSALAAAAGILEVDLVFPQNTTYAPTDRIPFVFAIQNAQLAKYLNPRLSYNLWDGKVWENITSWEHDLRRVNWSNSTLENEPYYAHNFLHDRFNTSGSWRIDWAFAWDHCDAEGWEDEYDETPDMIYDRYTGSTLFTIAADGAEIDMVGATAGREAGDESCPEDSGVAIRVTDETMRPPFRVEWSGAEYTNDTCVVVANGTETPSPCAVEIPSAVAASITASYSARVCNVLQSLNPPDDCPSEENAAGTVGVFGLSCVLAVVGGLGGLLL